MNLRSVDVLPDESLIGFPVERIVEARSIWKSRSWPTRHSPLDFAVIAPSLGKGVPGTMTAVGERYGGAGVGSNGGGVRCGIFESLQIKGIGRNPLAGVSTDYWHKHGAASLQDCVKEAIWSEVLDAALPYGAVRSLAIIDTRQTFDAEIEETKEIVQVPRGLLIREPALRPAHFMRAGFIDLGRGRSDQLVDVSRTKSALARFKHLSIIVNSVDDTPASVMEEVFRRAAWQLARARAIRIVHPIFLS